MTMAYALVSFALLHSATIAQSWPQQQDCSAEGCTAGGDVQSLMQSKVKAFVLKDARVESKSSSAPLLQQIETMSLLATNERNATLLKVIQHMLESNLLPGLVNATKDAQKEVDVEYAAIAQCNSDAIVGESAVDKYKIAKDKAETVHNECRVREAQKIADNKTKCEALRDFKAGLVYPAPIPSNTDPDATQLAHMDKANAFYALNAPKLRNLIEECNAASEALKAEQKQCPLDQGTFESHFCEYRAKLTDLQKNSSSCYLTKKEAYEAEVVEKNATQHNSWFVEYLAMKKIECFLQVWLSDKNVKTVDKGVPPKCKNLEDNLDYKQVSLNLGMEIPKEHKVSTDPVKKYPGSPGFVAAFYTNTDVTYSPVQACAGSDDGTDEAAVVVKMMYKEGKTGNGFVETIQDSVSLVPNVEYVVKFEVLRNDLGDSSEYVKDVSVGGQSLGSCHPDGGDYDCTFYHCSFDSVVSTTSGDLALSMTNTGHSWDCDCDKSSWECSKESTVSGRSPMKMVGRFTFTPKAIVIVTKMIYKEGKHGNGVDETIQDSVSLVPNVKYSVSFEVLRNDLGGSTEYVKDVSVGGQSLGACHPDGGDYDCTYFRCPFDSVVSTPSGDLSLSMTNTGHSWDCDCDKTTWECSKESTVSGRSAMKMVGRFIFTPEL